MSEQIYEANDYFPFEEISLLTPKSIVGGNYFSRFHVRDTPIFIQLPKCSTKAGVQTSGTNAKKAYSDLQFSPDHEKFLRWMERFIERIQDILVEHRKEWFETEMDRDEIEETFQNPLKPYKSGQMYLMRVGITIKMGKIILPIFNEEEKQVGVEYLKGGTPILGILEIQGLKYSSKCLQIEMEMKQVLCLPSLALFDKCVIHKSSVAHKDQVSEKSEQKIVKETAPKKALEEKIVFSKPVEEGMKQNENEVLIFETKEIGMEKDLDVLKLTEITGMETTEKGMETTEKGMETTETTETTETEKGTETETEKGTEKEEQKKSEPEQEDIQTVELSLDTMSLEPLNEIQLKNGKEIYYKMYREARQKAKLARDLAISSYLESKHIKNLYVLEDLSDDDEEKLFSLSLSQK